ncbi:MAG: hypothetical protein K6E85_09985 [Lachnospiraceae bacterium]|nr:hypothetical protein [Lachnospiraceae bacterium]
MQKISVYGARYCDIVLYLARTLQNLQYRVLVCDRSISKSMRNFVPVFEEFDLDRQVFDYGGFGYTYAFPEMIGENVECDWSMVAESTGGIPEMTYMPSNTIEKLKRSIEEDEDENSFDVLIILNDASGALADFWNEDETASCVRLFVTDEYPENIYEMRSVLRAINRNSQCGDLKLDGKRLFVVRDYTGTARTIIDELEKLAGSSKSFLIPWSKKDRKLEMLAAYNDGFRFIGASDRLLDLIEELCGSIGVDTGSFEYRRAYLKAGKGKRG